MCSYLDQVGSTYYFRRAVPKDLVGYFQTQTGKPRSEWKFSLRTKDRETAKRLLRPHEIETDLMIDDARRALAKGPLTDIPQGAAECQLRMSGAERPEGAEGAVGGPQECSGEVHSEREQEEREAQAALDAESRERRHARRELRTLWRQRRKTSTAMLEPEQAAAIDLLKERDAKIEELEQAIAIMEAGNDELGIPRAAPRADKPSREPVLSIVALYNRYALSGTANPKTVRKWRSRVESLIKHLGHDDARRVTRADMNGWTAALVAKGLAKKTIVDGYLPAVRAAFAIAHDDGSIPDNPATGLKVRAPKTVKLRERDHTDDEAATILRAALRRQPSGLADHHARARRWVPWLCAYTGARVGEMTQLRAMDIRQEQGIWVVHITPEAGSVKTHEARSVPLHPHLIEQGFTQLAKAGDATPLFYREGAGNEVNPASKVRAADLAKWVRSLGITAPAPNHGWRHRFKTMARAAGVEEYVADRIQGHAPRHAGGGYGFIPLATLRDAIEKLSPYEVGMSPALDDALSQPRSGHQRRNRDT